MNRSSMYINLLALFREGAITLDDLDGLSDELQGQFRFLMRDRD